MTLSKECKVEYYRCVHYPKGDKVDLYVIQSGIGTIYMEELN